MTLPQIAITDDTPVIAGTTVSIIQILAALAESATHDAIRAKFPNVSEDAIRAALHYAIGAVETADPALILEDEEEKDSLEDVKAGFLQGWHEAMTGVKGTPLENLWDEIDVE